MPGNDYLPSKYELFLFREKGKRNDRVSSYFFPLSISSISRKKLLLERDKSPIIVRYAYVKLCYRVTCERNINDFIQRDHWDSIRFVYYSRLSR